MLMQEGFTDDTWQMLTNVSWYAHGKNVQARDYDYVAMSNTTIDSSKNVRQWTYQYCTEFGWF